MYLITLVHVATHLFKFSKGFDLFEVRHNEGHLVVVAGSEAAFR